MQRLAGRSRDAESDFLACRVGRHVVAVPLARVVRLVEFDRTAPPPLAQPWLGGLGHEGGTLFPSLALRAPDPGSRRGKGLLLADGSLRFALEVDDVHGLIALEGERASAAPIPPEWRCPANWVSPASERQSGGDTLVLDVAAVAAALRGARSAA